MSLVTWMSLLRGMTSIFRYNCRVGHSCLVMRHNITAMSHILLFYIPHSHQTRHLCRNTFSSMGAELMATLNREWLRNMWVLLDFQHETNAGPDTSPGIHHGLPATFHYIVIYVGAAGTCDEYNNKRMDVGCVFVGKNVKQRMRGENWGVTECA